MYQRKWKELHSSLFSETIINSRQGKNESAAVTNIASLVWQIALAEQVFEQFRFVSIFVIWGLSKQTRCPLIWSRPTLKNGKFSEKTAVLAVFWREKAQKFGRESFFLIGNSRIFQKAANYTNIWPRSDKFLGLKYTRVHASINKYGWFWSDSRNGLQCLTSAGMRSRKCAWIRSDLMNGLCN